MFRATNDVNLNDALTRGMACAAIHPALRSILVFDAPYTGLQRAAALLTEMLSATGHVVEQVSLGVSEFDDELWGSLALANDEGNPPVVWNQGALAGLWSDSRLRLILIPDITKLSLAAVRACVMLMGADVAHLERYGQQKMWQPNMCWLAGCAKSVVGSISPHLLDRFMLRLNWQGRVRPRDSTELRSQVLNDKPYDDTITVSLPVDVREQLLKATQSWAVLTDDATKDARKRILALSATTQTYAPRRDLALARLALANAQIEGASQVTVSHVETAARLIGLIAATQQADGTSLSQSSPSSTSSTPGAKEISSSGASNIKGDSGTTEASSLQTGTPQDAGKVYAGDTTVVSDNASLQIDLDPYPEDKAYVEREAASLKLPFFRYTAASVGRGAVIGVERTRAVRDLAVVSTLFAAAPFQPIRHANRQIEKKRFILYPTDLRSFRRAPAAEHMFMVLLDYTSLRDSDWWHALLPYLIAAYQERASISIVRVGAANAANELRAEVVSARSVLVPTIAAALEVSKGRATPLAHGFDLAVHTLRHALQHGRSTVQRALLLVITDGRGNVPIEFSRTGRVTGSINRQGIDDTLRIARLIGNLKGVRTVLLNPQPKYYPELPLTLAEVLDAAIVNIPRLEEEE